MVAMKKLATTSSSGQRAILTSSSARDDRPKYSISFGTIVMLINDTITKATAPKVNASEIAFKPKKPRLSFS